MASRNTTTSSSTIRTDYGSTTLKISIDNDTLDTNSEDNIVGVYQSLPYTSTTNLYAKSSMTSRFSKMTIDTKGNNDAKQIGQRIESVLNVINQISIGFVTIYMSWLCLSMGLWGTALHAWLVTIGFTFLMAEGIMCHYNQNPLTLHYRRTTKTTIHWVLQALGGACGIAGVLIKCIQKGFQLHTTHGKLGFSAFILCCISMSSGLGALYSMRFKQYLSPLMNKTFHNILGIATFAVAMVAHFYGYNTGFFSRRTPSSDFTILMKVLTLMTLCLSSWGPLKSLYNKMRSIAKNYS
ncbi:transmembrane reductase CYB561D2-like [Haematobia irritans]|uniref:transmembrane reductase CYB561D2-like n=1 Tax=Haematobia irritans TaxID=7368 RepID=UPI003F4FC324